MKNNRMRISTKKLWLALAAVLFLWQAAPAWAQCERLAWQDEFNGPTIDLSKWELEVNGTGQGTGQLDYATARPQNASIVNGNLELNMRSTAGCTTPAPACAPTRKSTSSTAASRRG